MNCCRILKRAIFLAIASNDVDATLARVYGKDFDDGNISVISSLLDDLQRYESGRCQKELSIK
jgi:hypothetical protein